MLIGMIFTKFGCLWNGCCTGRMMQSRRGGGSLSLAGHGGLACNHRVAAFDVGGARVAAGGLLILVGASPVTEWGAGSSSRHVKRWIASGESA